MHRTRFASFAAAMILPLTGCYGYTAADMAAIQPGETVRARITAVEADRLAAQLPEETRVIEGRVSAVDNAAMMVDVPSATRRAGASLEVLRQRIELKADGILELERKQLDRVRTGGLAVLGAAGLAYIVATQLDGDPGQDNRPPPDPGERRRSFPFAVRLPLF